ncbi:hepatocyte nuclear factor 1-beta-like [Branchiostoma floridae x Branchiostoma japonicum]
MFGIFSCFTRNKMTDRRIEQMEPKFTMEQFNLLTRLVSIGEKLQQAGLPLDNMFKTIRMMQQSCHLGEKLPMCVTGPPIFTREQLILLTRQLSVYHSLQQTGLSEDSIFHIMPYMQQHMTTNIDIDELHQNGKESKEEKAEKVDGEVIPCVKTSLEQIPDEKLLTDVDELMRKNGTDMTDLHSEIKTFLRIHHISQDTVSKQIGTSQSMVSAFLLHGRGLKPVNKRALYTWYLRQKRTMSGSSDTNCSQQNTMKRTFDLTQGGPAHGLDHKQRRVMVKWPSAATMILERYFQMDTNPTENQREEIARACNDELQKAGEEYPHGQLMTSAEVQTWFMDRWFQDITKHQRS